ncbi:MAG: 50S ribosomal protein L33 [Deltaproteobacteria bacterium]|nr:50S ribosomal protein L33 [Deltaproteobacteria bacterium]
MGSRSDRIAVTLVCLVCGARNYKTSRARRPDAGAIELKKFCKVCKVHTVHVESK